MPKLSWAEHRTADPNAQSCGVFEHDHSATPPHATLIAYSLGRRRRGRLISTRCIDKRAIGGRPVRYTKTTDEVAVAAIGTRVRLVQPRDDAHARVLSDLAPSLTARAQACRIFHERERVAFASTSSLYELRPEKGPSGRPSPRSGRDRASDISSGGMQCPERAAIKDGCLRNRCVGALPPYTPQITARRRGLASVCAARRSPLPGLRT